jgi:hypothetical protein
VLRATPQVGTRIADRYRLEECRLDQDGVSLWDATDEMLARPVGIYLVPDEHELADAMISAARAAATVDDPRFVRVLDAVHWDGVVHIVHERFPQARSLRVVLALDGPLDPADAQLMITEAVEAVCAAHAAGLAHLRIQPDTVLLTATGQVKIFGLCLEAALHSTTATDPVRADVRGLGRVLHAALTARWPEGEAFGLPAALYENGAICTPRQIRAGVPDALDSVVDRVLNARPRTGTRVRTLDELAAALHELPHPRPPADGGAIQNTGSPVAADATVMKAGRGRAGLWPATTTRSAQIGVVAVLVLGLALLAWQIGRAISPGVLGGSGPPAITGPLQAIRVVDVIVFDPPPGGGQDENADQAPLALDGKPGSAWHTNRYRTANFGRIKTGVGLVVDLGRVQTVRQVKLMFPTEGTSVEIRAASAGITNAPADLDSYLVAASGEDLGAEATLRFAFATKTRFLLVWLTKLPKDPGGGYRSGISDIAVSG